MTPDYLPRLIERLDDWRRKHVLPHVDEFTARGDRDQSWAETDMAAWTAATKAGPTVPMHGESSRQYLISAHRRDHDPDRQAMRWWVTAVALQEQWDRTVADRLFREITAAGFVIPLLGDWPRDLIKATSSPWT